MKANESGPFDPSRRHLLSAGAMAGVAGLVVEMLTNPSSGLAAGTRAVAPPELTLPIRKTLHVARVDRDAGGTSSELEYTKAGSNGATLRARLVSRYVEGTDGTYTATASGSIDWFKHGQPGDRPDVIRRFTVTAVGTKGIERDGMREDEVTTTTMLDSQPILKQGPFKVRVDTARVARFRALTPEAQLAAYEEEKCGCATEKREI